MPLDEICSLMAGVGACCVSRESSQALQIVLISPVLQHIRQGIAVSLFSLRVSVKVKFLYHAY